MDPKHPVSGRRIGERADAAGLTVRTLHHYEEIGLLAASGRTDAGHRLYADDAVDRLYRICQLRHLGLPLTDIGRALDDPAQNLRATLAAQLADLDRQIDSAAQLRTTVASLLHTTSAGDPSTDDLLHLLEEMTMLEATVQRRISILVYADLEEAHDHLVRVFGLGPGELTRDDAGRVVHAELQAGDGVVWLHQESPEYGLASPKALGASTGSMAVMVDDVDAHHRNAVEQGAVIVYEPVDQPYGYREYSARDSEGGLWSFMKHLG